MSSKPRSLFVLWLAATSSLAALAGAPLATAAPTSSPAPTATATATRTPTAAPTTSSSPSPTTKPTSRPTPTATATTPKSGLPAYRDPRCSTDTVGFSFTGVTPGQDVEVVVFLQGTNGGTKRVVKANWKGAGTVTLPAPTNGWKPRGDYMVWVEGGRGEWLQKHTFTGPANACKGGGAPATSAPQTTAKDTGGGLAKTGV